MMPSTQGKGKLRSEVFDAVRWAFSVLAVIALLAGSTVATKANDSVAHVAAGGLVLSRTDKIELVSEDLFISADEVRVDYVFRNLTDKGITTLMAFPMPDLRAPSDDNNFVIPFQESANFLGFKTTVNGNPVAMKIEQRVHALGIDRTDLLKTMQLPLEPQLRSTLTALDNLSADAQERLFSLGMVAFEEYDTGQGMTRHARPLWVLTTTHYWSQVFPADQEISVSHTYTPSVGGSAQTMIGTDHVGGEELNDYRQRYCMDQQFERAARRVQAGSKRRGVLTEARLEYILKTGSNWAGPIKRFRLVVDKGTPTNLVSFCMDNVRKISATRFESVHTDYWPRRDLEILLLRWVELAQ